MTKNEVFSKEIMVMSYFLEKKNLNTKYSDAIGYFNYILFKYYIYIFLYYIIFKILYKF